MKQDRMAEIKKELAEINVRVENNTATGRDYDRRASLLMEIANSYSRPNTDGGVCAPITEWTRGRVTH